jgi:hypothetical protein
VLLRLFCRPAFALIGATDGLSRGDVRHASDIPEVDSILKDGARDQKHFSQVLRCVSMDTIDLFLGIRED